MTDLAIAYVLGCFTVPLLAWGVYRFDRWRNARLNAAERAEGLRIAKQCVDDLAKWDQ